MGPQQLKYMTVLNDSSDWFVFPCFSVVELIAEEESLLAWENEPTWFLRWCWADLKAWFHLHIPWSFKASTTPTLVATLHALIPELILLLWWWSCNSLLESTDCWTLVLCFRRKPYEWMNEEVRVRWSLYTRNHISIPTAQTDGNGHRFWENHRKQTSGFGEHNGLRFRISYMHSNTCISWLLSKFTWHRCWEILASITTVKYRLNHSYFILINLI